MTTFAWTPIIGAVTSLVNTEIGVLGAIKKETATHADGALQGRLLHALLQQNALFRAVLRAQISRTPMCAKPLKVRGQVRTIGTRFRVRTEQVRARSSHFWFAPANANPADGYQRGYHEKLSERPVAKC